MTMTIKDFLETPNQSSPDGVHWEPALPACRWWRIRLSEALDVLVGKAIAVRQTTKSDIKEATK